LNGLDFFTWQVIDPIDERRHNLKNNGEQSPQNEKVKVCAA
jgi:hypothetical protein